MNAGPNEHVFLCDLWGCNVLINASQGGIKEGGVLIAFCFPLYLRNQDQNRNRITGTTDTADVNLLAYCSHVF